MYVCPECREAGVAPQDVDGNVHGSLVACGFCGAVDERATYSRNTIDVSHTFGTLMNEHGTSDIQFREYNEKTHEDFINQLLDVYLVDPTSRLVERSAEHFKAGAKTWYNRMRHKEQRDHGYKNAPTRNSAKKVKFRLAVAIQFAIQESNIFVVNNRLAHVKPLDSSAASSASSRGDGSVMAPSLDFIFSRTQSLGADHIGYLDSMDALRRMQAQFKKLLVRNWSAVDITMANFYALSQRVQLLLKLPPDVRVRHLHVRDLKPTALRKKKTVETAGLDDFVLDSESWAYMSKVDWNQALEVGYNLFCAQQVVCLWGNLCSVNIASAVFIWAIQAVVGTPLQAMVGWTRELTLPYGGNMDNSVRRRNELTDQLIGWSTSFPEAGIIVPILAAPRKGTMGDGITGYASDRRRPIPEAVMSVAAAPLVAANWRKIMYTRLKTRSMALPLDTEFTMAAKMFAGVYDTDFRLKKAAARSAKMRARKTASAPASRFGSQTPSRSGSAVPVDRSASQPPSAIFNQAQTYARGTTREDMLRRMNVASTARAKSPTIEAMLATRDDSSDDEVGRDSDDDSIPPPATLLTPWIDDPESGLGISEAAGKPVAFGFSIGPDGFRVATKESDPRVTVPVGTAHAAPKRPGASDSTGMRALKRSRLEPPAPMSPPATSPSSRAPSPSLTVYTDATSVKSALPSPYLPPPSPSLREISMSPALTEATASGAVPVVETEATRHIGLLLREREQYAFFHPRYEARKGRIAPVAVQNAMNAWVTNAKAKGIIPASITRDYLVSLGIRGDPRKQDLGPFIRAHADEWSPVESLLRLGIKPLEFPPHLVVHSVIDLQRQLGRSSHWEDKLAPIGATLDDSQLDAELDILFAQGDEKWTELLCTPAEVKKKERMYRQQGVWDHPRDVPEGPKGALTTPKEPKSDAAVDESALPTKARGSTRINYDALQRLCYGGQDEGDEGGEETGGNDQDYREIRGVVQETLWDAIGNDAPASDDDDEDDEDD